MKKWIAMTIALAAVADAESPPKRIVGTQGTGVVERGFFDDKDAWKPGDPAAWKWEEREGERVLCLVKQSKVKPPVRSPFNLIWFEKKSWEGFDLQVEVRLTKFDKGNNDLCVAFAGKGPQEFYYAHLGEKADQVHHQIHLVNHADRKPITVWRSEGTPWKEGTWHKLRVVHRPATGEIAVMFDGESVLTAADKTLTGGKIGLGSFDDTGEFRRIIIR
ncbi:family 16 glycoside hydrolase [Haloferula helveola]|uniref:family 16 glycoside hydrolase n=1 Tax=Haloferula helveola TaxID=490095 RepID=UPI0030CB1267